MTLPLLFKAAKATSFEKICVTPEVKLEATEELSPPFSLSPHVITLPSLFKAAKALVVEKICVTPELKSLVT